MKVLVLGAGGIVGQHMMLSDPYMGRSLFWRRSPEGPWGGCDLTDWPATLAQLAIVRPDVIVNLAGESRVDVVEAHRDDLAIEMLNTTVPKRLGVWCDNNEAHLIHVSTQGVFDGKSPPYGPESPLSPITEYGRQKSDAEALVLNCRNVTIARLTFVLGVRPFAGVGRTNPLEHMLADAEQCQVDDHWFSPLFAPAAAAELWRLVQERPAGAVVHLGTPMRVSRWVVAGALTHAAFREPGAHRIHAVSHRYFPGLAPRPVDTTWAAGCRGATPLDEGLLEAAIAWRKRNAVDITTRSREIALYLGITNEAAQARLAEGFGAAHAAVAEDFRAAAPADDDALLAWYRSTDAYIWELTAYHLDAGFNYAGMCEGIVNHLAAAAAKRVLVLGDGIGDLSIALAHAGVRVTYNDLFGSATAGFANFRFGLELRPEQRPETLLSLGWHPPVDACPVGFDAVVALDVFEHLTEVEEWAAYCASVLRPGGLFLAQNAFACGDDEHGGSIPMHLTRNNRFEKDWDPLLESLGLQRDAGGWWRRPAEEGVAG